MGRIRKFVSVLVVVAMVLGVCGIALAQDAKVKGKVTAIDTAASTVTVTDKDGEEVVVVIGAEDLAKAKEGAKVRITYHEADGKNVADTVKWMPKKSAEGC